MRISDWSSDVCSSDLPRLSARCSPSTKPPPSCALAATPPMPPLVGGEPPEAAPAFRASRPAASSASPAQTSTASSDERTAQTPRERAAITPGHRQRKRLVRVESVIDSVSLGGHYDLKKKEAVTTKNILTNTTAYYY